MADGSNHAYESRGMMDNDDVDKHDDNEISKGFTIADNRMDLWVNKYPFDKYCHKGGD